MKMKLGIVGAGGIAQVHIDAAKKIGLDIAAVADVNEAAARHVAQTKNIPLALGDPQAIFASPEVNAVVIAVPNKFHAPLTIAALEAGKDVFVEKPMALSVRECDAMIAAATRHKRLLQVGFVNRYTPVAQTARAFIDAGRLGTVYHAKANYYRRRGIPGLGTWFTTRALSGGGPLIDLGVHVIDLALHLMHFPKVTRVSGKVYANFGPRMKKYVHESMWAGPPNYKGVYDVEDAAHALVRLEGGGTLEINTTWAGNFPENSVNNLIGLFGDKGGLTFQLGGDQVKLATEEQGHNVDVVPALREGNCFEVQLRAFADSVTHRKAPFATGEEGRAVQAVIDAIYESSEKDREVEV